MSRKHVTELIMELCALCDPDQRENYIAEKPIDIDDVGFSLFYSEEAEIIFAYCEFGDFPREYEADIYEALLLANFAIHGVHSPSFSVSPTTGDIMLCSYIPLTETLSATDMHERLIIVAEKAKLWRESFFLDDDSAPAYSDHAASSIETLNRI